MLHKVDSVVNQSVHLRTDDKSQAVKTEITLTHIVNVLAACRATLRIRIVEFCLHSTVTKSNCSLQKVTVHHDCRGATPQRGDCVWGVHEGVGAANTPRGCKNHWCYITQTVQYTIRLYKGPINENHSVSDVCVDSMCVK